MTARTGGEKPRLLNVDALRGFALLGILMVNIQVFANPFHGLGVGNPDFPGDLDRLSILIVSAFFETKFYLIFSFLFGYSVTLQMTAAERVGAAFRPRFLRRQGMLLFLGLAHALLLYQGDILVTYAGLGLVLYRLRHRGDASLLCLAGALVAGVTLLWATLSVAALGLGLTASPDLMADVRTAQAAFTGSVATLFGQRLRELADGWILLLGLQGPCALAMFLVGLVAGRRRSLTNISALRPLLHRLLKLGIGIGLPGGLLYAWTVVQPSHGVAGALGGMAVDLATGPFLSAAYMATALLVFDRFGARPWVVLLAAGGRMALSNYLMQSVVCALLFHAYGLGLMGRLPPTALIAIPLVLYSAQLLFSRWWLARHAMGPLEFLLRRVTYGAPAAD